MNKISDIELVWWVLIAVMLGITVIAGIQYLIDRLENSGRINRRVP